MATIVSTDLLSTVARMGLATLREVIQLVKFTNREYEKDIVGATPNSTVNIIVPAQISSVAVTPSHVPPGAAAVTPTKVPITLDQWYRAPFAFDDKQARQVDRGIVPMQVQEAIRSLANTIDVNVWLNYKKFYGFAGVPGTTPFGTDISEFLEAEKIANDQLMPADRRALLMDTAANANWKGLRRNYDKNFADAGAEAAWTQHVPRHVTGAAGTPLADDAGNFAAGVSTVHMDGFTTKPSVGDVFSFAGHTQTYTVVSASDLVGTDSDIVFEPALQAAVANDEAVTFKASHRVNLLVHPNAIAFAMAPMAQGLDVPGGSMEATVIDQVSGLALRLTVFRQYYQTEWSFDALWGSAVPRPGLGVRIGG